MLPSEAGEVDLAGVRRVVGSEVYRRGVTYARSFPVTSVSWNAREFALEGWVTGPDDEHSTTVYFVAGEVPLRYEQGQCSCRAGLNCVHVVALLVAATAIVQQQPGSRLKPRTPSWERSLGTLLDPTREDRVAWPRATPGGTVPLAIELMLGPEARSGYGAAPPVASYRLLARLMRPGKHGWWINGGLNWSSLGDSYTFADYPPRLVRLLREFTPCIAAGAGTACPTAIRTARTRRSTSRRSSPGSCGRCWKKHGRSVCGWSMARKGWASSAATRPPSYAWT